MSNLETAISIAAAAHAGTPDKDGQPYILHPLRVMFGVEGETARIVAVLHDVIEDTDRTLDDLRAAGFSEEVLTALELVTHRDDQSYADYVIACKPNPIARAVKLSDLRDNMSTSRLLLRADRVERDFERIQRYVLSLKYLQDKLSEQEYRELMAGN